MSEQRRRPQFFGQQIVRLMTKACLANELGSQAFTLLAVVAAQQDAAGGRPVSYFNGQLMPLIGVRKWDTLTAVRQACVDAGWLRYSQPGSGFRKPGVYEVLIPERHAALDDSRCDEGSPPEACPENGDASSRAYPGNGYGHGYARGDAHGESPSSITSITSSPNITAHRAPPKRRDLRFTPEDRAVAEWLWQRILELQPDRRAPRLEKWADEIRLMRERDGRTHDEIRSLFERVQADRFWRTNVLSPDKLREQWDNLQLRLRPAAGANGSIYEDLDAHGRATA